jgi:DNA-binding FrmR family transcriptional regulator
MMTMGSNANTRQKVSEEQLQTVTGGCKDCVKDMNTFNSRVKEIQGQFAIAKQSINNKNEAYKATNAGVISQAAAKDAKNALDRVVLRGHIRHIPFK